VRDAVRVFIAQVVDVAPTDISMEAQACGTPNTASCAALFGQDVASGGGSLYPSADPLAQELEANATAVEVTTWVPTKDGMARSAIFVMSGIADGVLVGMAVFNSTDACY
jgi:hypothetical protein